MKERPILFNGEMVRAILAGNKTQTRRVIKSQPEYRMMKHADGGGWAWRDKVWCPLAGFSDAMIKHCPYGQPGDRLWVRETWALCEGEGATGAMYRATFDNRYLPQPSAWRPSIFMPRWASRIMLEITSVRVERVQDISREDAMHEGVTTPMLTDSYRTLIGGFTELWDSINGARPGCSWTDNPYVWALTFRPV